MSKRPNPSEWNCPLCSHRCAFGTMGCDEPDTCERGEKNINYVLRGKPKSEGKSVGIALISEDEQK